MSSNNGSLRARGFAARASLAVLKHAPTTAGSHQGATLVPPWQHQFVFGYHCQNCLWSSRTPEPPPDIHPDTIHVSEHLRVAQREMLSELLE